MTNNDMISRSYAINRVKMAIKKSKSAFSKSAFNKFIEFLTLLPPVSELEEHVYCTNCQYFNIDGEDIDCNYKDICCLYNPEDSMAKSVRCCYSEK